MNAILERVRDSVKSDKAALGVGLSLLNVASVSPAAMRAIGRLVMEADPDAAPDPGPGFQLPGALFVKAVNSLELTHDAQLDLLGDYFDLLADDPGYSMDQFLIDVLGDDDPPAAASPAAAPPAPAPPPLVVELKAPGAPKQDGYVTAMEPTVAAEQEGVDDDGPFSATVAVNEASFAGEMESLRAPTSITARAPWWLEYPLGSKYQFNLDLLATEEGPYVDAFISDPSRSQIFADWPARDTIFGVYEHDVAGRRFHIEVVPTDEVVAPFLAG